MLVAGQRVTQQNGVRSVRIERAIGFVGNLDTRQFAAAIERQGMRQDKGLRGGGHNRTLDGNNQSLPLTTSLPLVEGPIFFHATKPLWQRTIHARENP